MGNKTFIILLYLFEPLSTHEEVLLPDVSLLKKDCQKNLVNI